MKLCFITCHYPPMARTYRRYGFARGLHEGGCDVEVVTHGNISHALGAFEDDDGLGTADSEFPVHRPKAMLTRISPVAKWPLFTTASSRTTKSCAKN